MVVVLVTREMSVRDRLIVLVIVAVLYNVEVAF